MSSYGPNNQPITITLASLANNAARASSAIDNSVTVYSDILVQLTLKTGASGVSINGFAYVYASGSTDGGTTYGEGATGSDAGITLTVPTELRLIGTVNLVANATSYKSNPMSVASAFNGTLPAKFAIVVQNESGAALDATAGNFNATYQGVSY